MITIFNKYIEFKDYDISNLYNTINEFYFVKLPRKDIYRVSVIHLPKLWYIIKDSISNYNDAEIIYKNELTRVENTEKYKQSQYEDDKELFKQQKMGLDILKTNKRFNIFFDTRTGKTRTVLYHIKYLLNENKIKKAIIFTMPSILQAWRKEMKELNMTFTEFSSDNKTVDENSNIVLWSASPPMFVDHLDDIIKYKFDLVVFDESSKIKSYKTKTAKAAFKLSEKVEYWCNLSATPAPNSEVEYYTQMRCIDPYIFYSSVTRFKSQWFFNVLGYNKKFQEKLVIQKHLKNEFMDLIKSYSVFVDQTIMNITEKIWNIEYFDINKDSKELYTNLIKSNLISIGNNTITTEQASSLRSKLSQITSGFIIDTEAKKLYSLNKKLDKTLEDNSIVHLEDYSRISKLQEIIRTKIGTEKCIIWANFVEEFNMIKKLLKDKCRILNGSASTFEKEQYIKEFNETDLQFLICHPLSVSMGLNFTISHKMIYYSLNDSYELFKQSSDRIVAHSSIQKFNCEYYIILAKRTVDELIYENLKNKKLGSDNILNYLKSSLN